MGGVGAMSRSITSELRAKLRGFEDGLTAQNLADMTGIDADNIRRALKAMPDVYIDRYLPPTRGRYPAVWCAVQVPEHCPYPTKQAA